MYFTWKKITANDCAFQIHFFFIQTFENGVIVGWRKMGGGDVRGQNVIVFMILFMATLLLRITIKCLSEDTLDTKVSFFWDQSQDISSRGFPPKIQASDWLTYLVYQLEFCFFAEKPLELMSWVGSQKKLILVLCIQ